ncbi:MAG: hypothetical protein QGH23_09635 [Dehalococcoidia bacterium]|jgi:hypothetical protein|nr:hypothetical protein [Dehalococcoidia bacterium]MDP6511452.1 hypothetical protein [Dehalococcoidia bacterium]MDP6782027.1 hypothetical protein [Dehalococcoidia bacterium]
MAEDYLKKELRVIYLLSFGFSLVLGVGFFLLTSLTGDYNILTRYGGASWVFLLALIIALPTVTPVMKRKYRG